MTPEIANERNSDTFNQWSHGTLNEFTEQSRDSWERMEGNIIWLMEITDDFEKSDYRPTNFQNIRETHGKQDEKLLFGVQN